MLIMYTLTDKLKQKKELVEQTDAGSIPIIIMWTGRTDHSPKGLPLSTPLLMNRM